MKSAICTVIRLILVMTAQFAFAADLVSDSTIQKQKDLTKVLKLKNGIPVVLRNVPESDIVQLDVIWKHGLKDLPPGKKALSQWLWEVLPTAGKNYPKDKLYEITEEFGLDLDCSGGIELSNCSLSTLNDFWDKGLPLLADIINQPAFTDEDVQLTKDRLIALNKNAPSDPNSYVNEIVNTVYYPKGHPYRLNHDEALAELATLAKPDLQTLHGTILNASLMSIIVVSSMPEDKLLSDLETAFGSISAKKFEPTSVQQPKFDQKNAVSLLDRELPTAYIRIKVPAPSITDKDNVATRFMFEVLSEELGEEIRTKRSLSYAVHSFVIQYSLGIGVISCSTAKPKETLEALHAVINQMKNKTYGKEELDEYKHVFATSYYLTQETHLSMAKALGSSLNYYNSPNDVYDMPRKLDSVSPEDIRRLANQILGDFRVGIIFGKKDFKQEWATNFIKQNPLKLGKNPP